MEIMWSPPCSADAIQLYETVSKTKMQWLNFVLLLVCVIAVSAQWGMGGFGGMDGFGGMPPPPPPPPGGGFGFGGPGFGGW
nr:unnamed protein product [Haemonchus contortus]